MKTKIVENVIREVELKTLLVDAGVRYWEDATVNGVEDEKGDLIPCRQNDSWCPEIDIDSGKILNWNQGTKADIHYKVCDSGCYAVKDANGEIVMQIDGYVPDTMAPSGEGYGDYIIMKVDESGMIEKWKFNPDDFNGEIK